ncbi:MAG: HPr family phosphocarrier protein [Pseudomonadota bacterium]
MAGIPPMASKVFVINNALGLHARAAAKMIKMARDYQAEVRLLKDGMQVDGKSILDVLSLCCTKGSTVTLVTIGSDADEALRAIGLLIEQGFGEE